jgi:urease accessory protein
MRLAVVMAMSTPRMAITMTTEIAVQRLRTDGTVLASGLLGLLWLASPALPVGGFSYSEGLEAAVEWAGIQTESDVCSWITYQLHLCLARADLAVLAQAIIATRAGNVKRLQELDVWVTQTRETSELLLQTVQMGRSLASWLRGLQPEEADILDGWQPTYPVAFAVAACAIAGETATVADILAAFAFGWAENMVQSAIKTVPLGQSSGQRILKALAAEIPIAVGYAMGQDDDSRQSLSPMLAILSARHETQYSRLFRS